MLRVVLKTAPSFGRSLANSSKTSDEVKSQTFLQVKSMLNINDVRLAQFQLIIANKKIKK